MYCTWCTCTHTRAGRSAASEFAGRARPRFRERGRAPRSRLSRSSPDATSQYRVSRSAELVSDLCQSRASSLSLFLSLSLSPPSFSISPLSSSTPGFPSRFDVYRVAARPSSRWFSTCPSGPFATRPLVAARPVQIDIHTYHGAGYTYSNTVLQWSYQWGKQKFSSQADVPRGDRRPPRSGSYSGSRCDREPRGSSHEERAPTLSIRDTQDERQQMEHRGAAPDQQEHQ